MIERYNRDFPGGTDYGALSGTFRISARLVSGMGAFDLPTKPSEGPPVEEETLESAELAHP